MDIEQMSSEMFWCGVICLFIGAAVGFIVAALSAAAHDPWDRFRNDYRDKDEQK